MIKIIIAGLVLTLSGCADLEKGFNVFSDTVTVLGAKLETAVTKKECTSQNFASDYYFGVAPVSVLQGQTVIVVACYAVHTTRAVDVRERRTITDASGNMEVLKDEYVRREPGRWQSKLNFSVPVSITPGPYKVTQEITYSNIRYADTIKITVYKKRS